MKKTLFALVAVSLLVAQTARAEEDTADGVRFRGGIALEGGVMIIPNLSALGSLGPQWQLGVQINNLVGIYAVPAFDILFGPAGGLNLSGAVLADFTFLGNLLTVGGGPDFGAFVAFGASGSSASAAGGAQYGGRVHLAVNPVVGHGENGIRRKALVIGIDARMLVGPVASASATAGGATSASASATGFVFMPMLTLGYQAF